MPENARKLANELIKRATADAHSAEELFTMLGFAIGTLADIAFVGDEGAQQKALDALIKMNKKRPGR